MAFTLLQTYVRAPYCMHSVPATTLARNYSSLGHRRSLLVKTSYVNSLFKTTVPSERSITEATPNQIKKETHICVATETGIDVAFRSQLHRFLRETPSTFNRCVWLFYRVSYTHSILHDDEFKKYQDAYGRYFNYTVTKKTKDCKEGVEDIFGDYATRMFHTLKNKETVIHIDKDVVNLVKKSLKQVAMKENVDWEKKLDTLKNNNQWREERPLKLPD